MKINIVNKSSFDLPRYETDGSVGIDLKADLKMYDKSEYDPIDDKTFLNLEPHKIYIIPTGIFISLPEPVPSSSAGDGWGYEAQIRPRSGMCAKHGVSVLNTPGTIDPDYRGEIKVIIINQTNIPYRIEHGDRIAQMVMNRYERISWNVVDNLDETDRGEGGFGSTGK